MSVTPDSLYTCEDCRITRRLGDLEHGCPRCGGTMVPAEFASGGPITQTTVPFSVWIHEREKAKGSGSLD